MATSPTPAQAARQLARTPSNSLKPLMSNARARGFAMLAATIGSIPGCSLKEFSVAPFARPNGKTNITLTVVGRGPALNATTMTWSATTDISGDSPDVVAATLVNAFSSRIERQRQRAEEDLIVHGRPIPWPIYETVTGALNLSIDRLTLWSINHSLVQDPTPMCDAKILRMKPNPNAVSNYASLTTARIANRIIKAANDSGASVLKEDILRRIHEISTPSGVHRLVVYPHGFEDVIVAGPAIVLHDITLPQTVEIAVTGQLFHNLADLTHSLGSGFSRIVADRQIERIESYGTGILVHLVPDPVRIDDIGRMTMDEITGEG